MTYAGGFRERLISDSVYYMIRDSLAALGWFDAGRHHGTITTRTEPVVASDEIDLNTLVIGETSTLDNDAEMGSTFGEIITTYYVDFYAENEAIGKELIHDVRDIVKGRIPSIGRTSAVLSVYDWSLATPSKIFYCDIEDVVVDQARDFPKPWQAHWWACRFDIVDAYGGE